MREGAEWIGAGIVVTAAWAAILYGTFAFAEWLVVW
jgi:hypothetical protein